MDLALWHKFTQHESLKRELLATDDAELIEVGIFYKINTFLRSTADNQSCIQDSDKDPFWGVGADRRGRNELGKALERLRTKLRDM
jgi:diaminohydroxyphosphoribosylaminopyrimidine deaminase/5-amino-6-(5-phosphoribosylamino)uracil reductase